MEEYPTWLQGGDVEELITWLRGRWRNIHLVEGEGGRISHLVAGRRCRRTYHLVERGWRNILHVEGEGGRISHLVTGRRCRKIYYLVERGVEESPTWLRGGDVAEFITWLRGGWRNIHLVEEEGGRISHLVTGRRCRRVYHLVERVVEEYPNCWEGGWKNIPLGYGEEM